MSSLPSHTELTMPALSPTMTQGNIATFKVKVGDKVAPGDLICEIETDKATIGWESQARQNSSSSPASHNLLPPHRDREEILLTSAATDRRRASSQRS